LFNSHLFLLLNRTLPFLARFANSEKKNVNFRPYLYKIYLIETTLKSVNRKKHIITVAPMDFLSENLKLMYFKGFN